MEGPGSDLGIQSSSTNHTFLFQPLGGMLEGRQQLTQTCSHSNGEGHLRGPEFIHLPVK